MEGRGRRGSKRGFRVRALLARVMGLVRERSPGLRPRSLGGLSPGTSVDEGSGSGEPGVGSMGRDPAQEKGSGRLERALVLPKQLRGVLLDIGVKCPSMGGRPSDLKEGDDLVLRRRSSMVLRVEVTVGEVLSLDAGGIRGLLSRAVSRHQRSWSPPVPRSAGSRARTPASPAPGHRRLRTGPRRAREGLGPATDFRRSPAHGAGRGGRTAPGGTALILETIGGTYELALR